MVGSGIGSIVFAVSGAVDQVSVSTNKFKSYYFGFKSYYYAHVCQLNAIKLWLVILKYNLLLQYYGPSAVLIIVSNL